MELEENHIENHTPRPNKMLVGLSLLIFLLEVADELLCVDILLGIRVDKVKLTSDKLVSVLVPGFWQ